MRILPFALCWSCAMAVVFQKYTYSSVITDIELNSRLGIKLTCASPDDINFFFRRSFDEIQYDADIPHTSINTKYSNETNTHQSILTLHNVSASNVGQYGCISSHRFKEFYIFVKDSKNELVPVKNRNIVRLGNESIIIPCKPTSPEVSVEIYEKNQKTWTWEPVTSYFQDDHTGFALFNDNSEQYMCRSKGKSSSVLYFNVTNERPFLELNVDPSKPTVISHTIKNHDGANMALGGNITLTCSISYYKTSKISHMSWILPNNQRAKDNSRTNVTVRFDFPTPFHEEYLTRVIQLTIRNATFENSGKYTCDVNVTQGYEHIRINRRTAVTIIHGNESFVELTIVDALTTSNVPLSSQVRIVVDYSAYPLPSVYWTKDGSEERLKGDKYNMSKNQETVSLTISNVSFDDAGNYTLRVLHRSETITQQVHITEKPIVNMIVGCQKCICQAKGYPAAKLAFKFIPCPDENFVNCTKNVAIITPSVHSHKEGHLTTSTYVIPSNTSGYGICEATNSEGTSFVEAKLLSSDLEDELTLARKPPESDIFVGERVIFLCASVVNRNIKFRHKDTEMICNLADVFYLTQWTFRKQLMLDNITVDGHEHNGVMLIPNRTDVLYSTQWVFHEQRKLDNVTKNLEGTIGCEANNASSSEFHEMNLTLSFHKASQPIILKSVHGRQTTELNAGSKFEIKCNATGNPQPSIAWFKSNNPLVFNSSSTLQLLDIGTVLSFKELNFNDTGWYTCKANNRFGQDEKSWELIVNQASTKHIDPNIDVAWIISSAVIVIMLLIIIICVILVLYCKKSREIKTLNNIGLSIVPAKNEYLPNPEIFLNDQADYLSYNDEYEFPREKLTLGKQVGAGHFGMVMKATARGIMSHEDETTVAAKMVKNRGNVEEMRALASELKMMIHIGQHLNVVNLLGAVTKHLSKNPLFIIVEYCCYGNVADHLKKHRNDFVNQIEPNSGIISVTESTSSSAGISQLDEYIQIPADCNTNRPESSIISVTTTDLLCWASQVACGMDYLVSKNVLHGDLAARNILLCKENVVKICDFGLAQSMRSDYKCKKQSDQVLPVKWLALECIESNTFGTPSDVWAYGVMLWEFFSLANVPYPGIPAKDLFSKLRDGYRLECPAYANMEIYNMMLRCWYVSPASRPTFNDLSVHFNSMLPTELQEYYINRNEPYLAMNVMRTNKFHVYDSIYDGIPQKRAPLPPL